MSEKSQIDDEVTAGATAVAAGGFVVQSHRGAGALSTDNTREAFELGWSLGTIPEADVRTTRDGVLVAFHDDTFARVVAVASDDPVLAAKRVADVTWAELAGFDVGSWRGVEFAGQRVPRLDAIFALMRGRPERRLYLDVKDVALEALSAAVDAAGVGGQVILASWDYAVLKKWAALRPGDGRTLYWMGTWGNPDEEPLRARFREMRAENFRGVTQVQVHAGLRLPLAEIRRERADPFTPSDAFFREVAAELRERGVLFQSLPWGGADEDVYWKLLDLGVESFATDHPDVTLAALRAWRPREAVQGGRPLSVAEALAEADETRALEIGEGVLGRAPALFAAQFGDAAAVVVSDEATFAAAGSEVDAALRAAGRRAETPFAFGRDVYAGFDDVERLEAALRRTDAVPVAVGSGTLNDLVKLAAHRLGRPYLAVATAASMDGYTAFGASITKDGSKQTFTCPAPRAVLADVAVIAAAPPELGAAGYADLQAKVTAGADWLLADALGVEPMDGTAWRIVQGGLREALADPEGVARGDRAAVRRLTEGLMLGGFAMQRTKSSRPASGAEHQFSHLWDMQHHTHGGRAPSHGFKVGIATLAVTALYEWLLEQPLEALDIGARCAAWPESPVATVADTRWWNDDLAAVARAELPAKWISREALRGQLAALRSAWPALRDRLRAQLLPFAEVKRRLRAVGAPHEPEQIGITRERLRASFAQAQAIRRRFTVLDLAVRTGTLEAGLDALFGRGGRWPL